MGLAAQLGVRPPGRTRIGRAIRWVAGSRIGARLIGPILPALDRATLRVSGGRTTISDGLAGVPSLFLTTTGARTGRARTAQLIAVPAGEDLAVIGSNFGRDNHPGWVHNLIADPRAIAGYRERSIPVIARELTGAEADQIWAAARLLNRGFATYPQLAAGRTIRVFRLEPLDPAPGATGGGPP
jgi:deazaflavin-dependent oxidoreductase (nitroreductase family)